MNEIGPNFIARPYRGVSVQDAPSLDAGRAAARTCARGACTGGRSSSSRSAGTSGRSSSSSARRVTRSSSASATRRVLAEPAQVAFVVDESVDTGNASQLARVSDRDALVTVVEGRFQHVNFIFAPAPLRIRVVEVVPPFPPKLLDMARTVLAYDEDLPPLRARPRRRSTCASWRPRTRPSTTCSRAAAPGWSSARRSTSSTPARPSRPTGRCSAASARARSTPRCTATTRTSGWTSARCWSRASRGRRQTLLKCCLRERGIERSGARMTVPWGASLEEVRGALRSLAGVTT